MYPSLRPAEAFKAQLARVVTDRSTNPRMYAAALARQFRDALSTVELTVLIADLSGELHRARSMVVDATLLKHHSRQLAVLEAALDVAPPADQRPCLRSRVQRGQRHPGHGYCRLALSNPACRPLRAPCRTARTGSTRSSTTDFA